MLGQLLRTPISIGPPETTQLLLKQNTISSIPAREFPKSSHKFEISQERVNINEPFPKMRNSPWNPDRVLASTEEVLNSEMELMCSTSEKSTGQVVEQTNTL